MKVLIRLDGQHRGFFDIQSYMVPDGVRRACFSFKDSVVSFLPNIPDEEPRKELPKSVENGIFIRVIMRVLDGVSDVSLLTISSFA